MVNLYEYINHSLYKLFDENYFISLNKSILFIDLNSSFQDLLNPSI
jgi:hypothetical protein